MKKIKQKDLIKLKTKYINEAQKDDLIDKVINTLNLNTK